MLQFEGNRPIWVGLRSLLTTTLDFEAATRDLKGTTFDFEATMRDLKWIRLAFGDHARFRGDHTRVGGDHVRFRWDHVRFGSCRCNDVVATLKTAHDYAQNRA